MLPWMGENWCINMDPYEIQIEKDMDAIRWMYTEILIRTFNDILPSEWYIYHMSKFLSMHNKNSKKVLKKHFEAINWLLSDERDLCFRVLGLQNLSQNNIMDAINFKIYGHQKFMKSMRNYQESKLQAQYDSQRKRYNSESGEGFGEFISK